MEFPSDYMSYLARETAGTLCAGWDEIGANVVEGSPGRLRIGGYDVTGCGVQARAALVHVCFELTYGFLPDHGWR